MVCLQNKIAVIKVIEEGSSPFHFKSHFESTILLPSGYFRNLSKSVSGLY